MPKAKYSRRKRSVPSVPSSCESIEDEDIMLDQKEGPEDPETFGSLLQDPSGCKSDQENDTNASADLSNHDPDNEMNKMLQLLGNDMAKSVSAKRKKMEKFTDAAIKINLNKMTKLWNEQLKNTTSAFEQFDRDIRENVNQWEDELLRQNEKSDKVNNILLQHMKVQQQINLSNTKKLASFRNIVGAFSKNIKNLEKQFSEINETVNQEMKTELMMLQKKILMETQQQDLQEVRKSVQTLLFT